MEKDYVKMLMESDKPMEERLRLAGKILNNMHHINENNETIISNYKKIIENYEHRIEFLKKKAGVDYGEHEITK